MPEFPQSTAIAQASYNVTRQQLMVQFTDGSMYVYHDFDAQTWKDFLFAGSKGTFFNYNIRDVYGYTKVG